MLGRQHEQGFERNMAVEAAIITKNELARIVQRIDFSATVAAALAWFFSFAVARGRVASSSAVSQRAGEKRFAG
jgi:hypothetical protein